MSYKHLSKVFIIYLVLVGINPTANGDTLSKEQKEVLITGLLGEGYGENEIPELLELAGFAGGPSISKEARDICLKILTAPIAVTEKTDNQQQKRAIAVAYEIVKAEDISYPGKKRMNYKIVVSPEIKRHQVEPMAKTIIADIIAKDKDIDDICLWLYSDRKLASHSGYDVAIVLWTPDRMTVNVKENLEEYLRQRGKAEEGVGDYPYNLSPALIDKDGDGKNSINDWRRMNLEEKRKQAIYNLIRANKDVTKKSVDTMINNLNNLAALR